MNEDDRPHVALATHTLGGATVWLTQTPALSMWRGDVGKPDWLRVETADGRIEELELPAFRELRLGRHKAGMPEPPDLAHPDMVSSQAATLSHDGVRWFLSRRPECHERVPVTVGMRSLEAGQRAALVHGSVIVIGRFRAVFVDRRYVVAMVPAGVVDPLTGLLSREGLEHEIAGLLGQGKAATLVLTRGDEGASEALVRRVADVHAKHPRLAAMHDDGEVALLVPADRIEPERVARDVLDAFGSDVRVGLWPLGRDVRDAALELELAFASLDVAPRGAVGVLSGGAVSARVVPRDTFAAGAAGDARRAPVLFAIEGTHALHGIGPSVVPALSRELLAVVAARAPTGAQVAELAQGVVGALVRDADADALTSSVQRDWHGRPPLLDGAVEHPRSVAVEHAGKDVLSRAELVAREHAAEGGALTSLSGGLPHPIAARVALVGQAVSSVERIKLLFDVLEGAWRFVAVTLAAAALGPRGAVPTKELAQFARAQRTRDAYPLGTWRELARHMADALAKQDDPMGALARDLLRVRSKDESLEALANQLHPLRNQFAHTVYPEARAQGDLPVFEQAARDLLRALGPLATFSLVTIEAAEPDLYGDTQRVTYVDHTGPSATGTRRTIVFRSPVRLAHVVYLVRFREGLVVPLEPFVRRVARGHSFDLVWIDHLPRAGACSFSTVLRGEPHPDTIDPRRLPPALALLPP